MSVEATPPEEVTPDNAATIPVVAGDAKGKRRTIKETPVTSELATLTKIVGLWEELPLDGQVRTLNFLGDVVRQRMELIRAVDSPPPGRDPMRS